MSHDYFAPTRRSLLSGIGAGIAAGLVGTAATAEEHRGSAYALVQGDDCVPIQPVEGTEPVRSLYEYRLPERYVSGENGAVAGETGLYASEGTKDLQRAQTSVAFLYRGPERLHLVFVHGSATADDGGAVTFELSGLPADGRWHVKDDLYRDPDTGEIATTNYDDWNVSGTDHRIDWTWGSSGTDGGAFGGLGEEFEIAITPSFNESATLHDRHYQGTVTDWEFVSGGDGGDRIALDMQEPIRITTTGCESEGEPDGDDESGDRGPGERGEGRGPGDRGEGRGPGDRGEGRGPGDRGEGRGPGDRGEGRGPGERGEGRGPGDRGEGRGPPDDAEARGPGDRGRGRGPPGRDGGSGSGDRDRGRGRGDRGRGDRGRGGRGRGRGR